MSAALGAFNIWGRPVGPRPNSDQRLLQKQKPCSALSKAARGAAFSLHALMAALAFMDFFFNYFFFAKAFAAADMLLLVPLSLQMTAASGNGCNEAVPKGPELLLGQAELVHTLQT